MNIAHALLWARNILGHLPHPQLEAEVLLGHVIGKDRSFLKAHPEFILEDENLFLYKSFIQKRSEHLPIDYIVGYKDWCDMRLEVNASVLIPRDETEILVRHIIETLSRKGPIRILDIGTGSGAIALALARSCKVLGVTYQVLGVDISPEALSVAQNNAHKYPSDNDNAVMFLESDLLTAVPRQHWDIIVANLPYVPKTLPVSPEVQKEPDLALFSGQDGLDHYRRLKQQLASFDGSFGQLWIEHLPQQKTDLEHLFRDYQIKFKKDLGGEAYFACITTDSHA